MNHPRSFPRGGVQPPSHKDPTAGEPIRNACLPPVALLAMRQHAGKPARCLVRPGEAVREGQRIGAADGPGSANVHSPIPGFVREVLELELPGGLRSEAVCIELSGEFGSTGRPRSAHDWRQSGREQLLARIEELGVVGLAGGEPTAAKLREADGPALLLANGVESEPYLTADHRLLAEKAEGVLDGALIAASLLGLQPGQVRVCVTEGSGESLPGLGPAVASRGFGLETLEPRYPQGEEQLLRRALAGRRSAGPPVKAVVLNVGTLLAIRDAVLFDAPCIERVLTVGGGAIRRPGNLKARLGTPLKDLVADCGGFAERPARLVVGGPLRGFAVSDLEAPLTKGTSAVLALTAGELRGSWHSGEGLSACIGCGRCIEACPWGLRPLELYKWLRAGEAGEAGRGGLAACTECGCCAYVCPSRLPLARTLADGKRRKP